MRNVSEVDWVSKDTKDATGRGRSVVPDVAGTWLGINALASSGSSAFSNIMSHE